MNPADGDVAEGFGIPRGIPPRRLRLVGRSDPA
jgi:hypothetical protein